MLGAGPDRGNPICTDCGGNGKRAVEAYVTDSKEVSHYERPISEHGGSKYLRTIYSADGNHPTLGIKIDVYCVIEAFGITCPALQHALKKLLACGQRGKGSKIDDIHGAQDALWRALELQKLREETSKNVT